MKRLNEAYRHGIPIPAAHPDYSKIQPVDMHVATWSKRDLEKVMYSDGYKNAPKVQNKVKRYFEFNYPE